MSRNTIVPDRRRQHFPPASKARIDDRTRAIGRKGLARARAELRRHRIVR